MWKITNCKDDHYYQLTSPCCVAESCQRWSKDPPYKKSKVNEKERAHLSITKKSKTVTKVGKEVLNIESKSKNPPFNNNKQGKVKVK